MAVTFDTPQMVVMKYSEFVGPSSHRDRDNGIGSNFWKFYLINLINPNFE